MVGGDGNRHLRHFTGLDAMRCHSKPEDEDQQSGKDPAEAAHNPEYMGCGYRCQAGASFCPALQWDPPSEELCLLSFALTDQPHQTPRLGAACRCKRLKIGREHVSTPVTNAQLVCHLLLEKQKQN